MALFPIGPEANRQPDIKPKGYIYRQGTQPISFAGLGASAAESMALLASSTRRGAPSRLCRGHQLQVHLDRLMGPLPA